MLQQRNYAQLLSVTRGYTCYIRQATNMQAQMATTMDLLAKMEPHTADAFNKNAHAQRCIVDATQLLLAALDHFNETLQTLTEKVIDDTILTIKNFDRARSVRFPVPSAVGEQRQTDCTDLSTTRTATKWYACSKCRRQVAICAPPSTSPNSTRTSTTD